MQLISNAGKKQRLQDIGYSRNIVIKLPLPRGLRSVPGLTIVNRTDCGCWYNSIPPTPNIQTKKIGVDAGPQVDFL